MISKFFIKRSVSVASLLSITLLAACGGGGDPAATNTGTEGETPTSNVTGSVLIDGSSTVFPISEAMAEEFMAANPGVQVTVGLSGTGGGFKKFCADETDITGASRPIKPEEVELCEKNGIEYVEMPVAFDGLTVVVHPDNDFVTCLTVEELKKMWEPAAQGKITNWNQVREGFPDKPLGLYGAGTDSGTYDYFTTAIVGNEGESRGDYTASEDDNMIVQGVAGDTNSIGFFGYAYYVENQEKLKAIEIDNGAGCVLPSPETISDGSYQPLSRPEFVYVKASTLNRPEVVAVADFFIAPENAYLVSEVGYVPLPTNIEDATKARLDAGKTGSVFAGEGSQVGVSLEDLLKTK